MADPEFIGQVRFGPCSCFAADGRRLFAIKSHHQWQATIPHLAGPPPAYLTAEISGPYLGGLDGIHAINRLTGRTSSVPSVIPRYSDPLWYLDPLQIWAFGSGPTWFAYDFGLVVPGPLMDPIRMWGRCEVRDQYAYTQLAADLDEVLAAPEVSIAWIPWGMQAVASRSEVAVGSRFYPPGSTAAIDSVGQTPWDGVSRTTGGVPTGTIEFVRNGAGAVALDRFTREVGTEMVETLFRWGAFLTRAVVQLRAVGYFSTRTKLGWERSGESVIHEAWVDDVRYWVAGGGICTFQSPVLTPSEAELGDLWVRKILVIEYGAMPPSGVDPEPWPGSQGAAGGYC